MSEGQPAPQPSGVEPTPPFYYRFRSTATLLDTHQELEKQYIYFSSPEQLNDPLEGLLDIYWRGDEIVWKNLLRHYLLCLTQTMAVALVAGKDFKFEETRGFVFTTPSLLPTEQYRKTFEDIWSAFISDERIKQLPVLLSKREYPIRREELEFYFSALHFVALEAISKVFRLHSLMPPEIESNTPLTEGIEVRRGLVRILEQIVQNPADVGDDVLRAVFSASDVLMKQLRLRKLRESKGELDRAWYPILYGFPEHYVDNLKELIFIDWYAACFVSDPLGLAMWGHYGDGHKGVCLKFRGNLTGAKPTLKFKGIVGFRGGQNISDPIAGDIVLPFEKVAYRERLLEIDFFRSIGRLPIPRLKEMWFTDAEGQRSEYADQMLSGQTDWRAEYWENFRLVTTIKLGDWESESESRLILSSVLDSFKNPDDRKLTYDFQDLEGVIFGIRTPVEDKIRIVEIISKKLLEHDRDSFEFSQATYNSRTGKIEVRPLDMIL